jgi:hypothetical protein
LIIVPAKQREDAAKPESAVGFVDFVELLPNLDTLSVWWPLRREDAQRLPRLPTRNENARDQQHLPSFDNKRQRIPSALRKVRVRAKFNYWSDALPEDTFEDAQLGCLLRQVGFVPAPCLCISIGSGALLEAMDRERYLAASLLRATNIASQA